jgi:hypothetical protein
VGHLVDVVEDLQKGIADSKEIVEKATWHRKEAHKLEEVGVDLVEMRMWLKRKCKSFLHAWKPCRGLDGREEPKKMAYDSEDVWEEVLLEEAHWLALEVEEKLTRIQQDVKGDGMIEGEEIISGLCYLPNPHLMIKTLIHKVQPERELLEWL